MRWIWVLVWAMMLSGCATYDRVAVWYKYRRDFHLPKPQPSSTPRISLPQGAGDTSEAVLAQAPTSQEECTSPLLEPENSFRASPQRDLATARDAKSGIAPKSEKELIPLNLTGKDRARLYRKLKADFAPTGEPRRTHWATTTGFILTLAFAGLIGLAFWVGHMRLAGWNNLVWVVLLLLFSIPVALLAFIFSVIGLQETTLHPDIYKNMGLAIASIALTAGFLISVLIGFIRSR